MRFVGNIFASAIKNTIQSECRNLLSEMVETFLVFLCDTQYGIYGIYFFYFSPCLLRHSPTHVLELCRFTGDWHPKRAFGVVSHGLSMELQFHPPPCQCLYEAYPSVCLPLLPPSTLFSLLYPSLYLSLSPSHRALGGKLYWIHAFLHYRRQQHTHVCFEFNRNIAHCSNV